MFVVKIFIFCNISFLNVFYIIFLFIKKINSKVYSRKHHSKKEKEEKPNLDENWTLSKVIKFLFKKFMYSITFDWLMNESLKKAFVKIIGPGTIKAFQKILNV